MILEMSSFTADREGFFGESHRFQLRFHAPELRDLVEVVSGRLKLQFCELLYRVSKGTRRLALASPHRKVGMVLWLLAYVTRTRRSRLEIKSSGAILFDNQG